MLDSVIISEYNALKKRVGQLEENVSELLCKKLSSNDLKSSNLRIENLEKIWENEFGENSARNHEVKC